MILIVIALNLPHAACGGDIVLGQVLAKGSDLNDKDLGAAVQKLREGRNDEALGLIREMAAEHPDWPPAPLIMARLMLVSGQTAVGRRALERAAVETPHHPAVYLTFGTLALAESRYSDARLNFEAASAEIKAGKWNAEQVQIFRSETLAGLAAVAEAREEWPAAHGYLNNWLELQPKNGNARQRLGGVLFRLGKQNEAFTALKQAVKDAPSLDPAAVTMSRLMGQKGNVQKAEEWLDFALKEEPKSARVRIARAGWLVDQGRAADAKPEADQAVKLDPASHEARRLQALIAWHLRDLSTAETMLESLHREAPADLAAADLLALCLVDQDDPTKRSRGLQVAEADARQSPRSPEALATLGWAHYRSGHLDQAERLLRAAVQGVRTTPDIAYFLSRVLSDRGQTDDARKVLQSATGLPGAFAHRQDANTLLKSLPEKAQPGGHAR